MFALQGIDKGNKMKKEYIDISKFMNPSDVIIKSILNLEKLYQLINQENIKTYIKKAKQKGFEGTIREYYQFKDVEELLSSDGKFWEQLQKAIFLLDKYDTNVDVKKFADMSKEDIDIVITIIKQGIKAHGTITKWLKPLADQKDVVEAVNDAMKVSMDKFQILKIADINTTSNKKIALMNNILEIKSPDELIGFIRSSKTFNDCLILTFQKNPDFDFKGVFYIFLLYKNKLYSIDNSERRVNLKNTAGARRPDRYLEKYDDIWLPVDLILDDENEDKKKPKNRLPILAGTKVYKAESFQKIMNQSPATIYWLNTFIYRIMEHLATQTIEEGLTFRGSLKLLTYINEKHDYKGYKSVGCQDLQGAGAYLIELYGKEVSKELVVTKNNVPELIGTRKYIKDVIEYERRKILADNIEKALWKDYNQNHKSLYKWINDFVNKRDITWIVRKALLDKKYTFFNYAGFSGFTSSEKEGLNKKTILSFAEYHYKYKKSTQFQIIGNEDYEDRMCIFKDHKVKTWLILTFIDYRQFLEFFEIDKKDVPKRLTDYLHCQKEKYNGNSILDDLDPVDEISDPYFTQEGHGRYGKSLEVATPLCKRCKNKYSKEVN